MANIVDSVLKVEGSSELVEQFLQALPGLIREDKSVYCAQSEAGIVSECEGRKTVSMSFETKWHAPHSMLIAAVRKYHHLGLDFHLWWQDDDGGLGPDPLFGGDLVVISGCFGEFCTRVLGDTWFSEGQGEINFLAIDRSADEHADCYGDWFRQRAAVVGTAARINSEEGLRAMVQEAYPERSILTAKFPRPDEVLADRVVNIVQRLNELIRDTWGPQWFEKNNKTFGEVTPEELGGLYDMLIDEAYPEEAARMRARAEQAQHDQERLDSADDGEDYFAGLAKAPPSGGEDPAS